jgi:hypothetical protein
MQRLLEVTKPYMAQDRELTIKYTGSIGNCDNTDQLLQAGQRVSKALDFPVASVLNEHSIYNVEQSVGSLNKATIQMIRVKQSHSCYLVVRLVSSVKDDFFQANQWQVEMDVRLTKQGIGGQWNMMVQGIAADSDVQKDSTQAIMKSFLHTVNGKTVESYTDQGTLSLSLYSEQFRNSIKSREHAMNLQAALHRNSITGEMRLTVATPIITAEY